MPRGGLRAGAGRKPVDAGVLAVRGGESRLPAKQAKQAAVALPELSAPDDLPAVQKAVWRTLAPLAARARTLTPETVPAFRDLCEAIMVKRALWAQIEADGLMQTRPRKAHPLLSRYQIQVGRVETKQARFLLEATGRPAPAVEKEADPFDEFEGTVQ